MLSYVRVYTHTRVSIRASINECVQDQDSERARGVLTILLYNCMLYKLSACEPHLLEHLLLR